MPGLKPRHVHFRHLLRRSYKKYNTGSVPSLYALLLLYITNSCCMKCMVITYIKSDEVLHDVESLMGFLHFNSIESNNNYRVFSGNLRANLSNFVNRIHSELEHTNFDVEDSMFIVYPVLSGEGSASMSNIIIKRKGNKYLRK